jgi:ABC-type bacteriocin/lantibiotic exporter with double-glycine peptidase domain
MPHLWVKEISARLKEFVLVCLLLAFCPPFAHTAERCGANYRRLGFPPLVLQETEYTCGAACLVSLVRQLSGKELKESHVAAVIGSNRSIGTTPEKMVKGLALLGFSAKAQDRLGLRALRSNFRRRKGQILLIQSGDTAHWVVLADYTGGKIMLMDPWWENKTYLTYTEQEFLALWSTTLLGKKAEQLALVVE